MLHSLKKFENEFGKNSFKYYSGAELPYLYRLIDYVILKDINHILCYRNIM